MIGQPLIVGKAASLIDGKYFRFNKTQTLIKATSDGLTGAAAGTYVPGVAMVWTHNAIEPPPSAGSLQSFVWYSPFVSQMIIPAGYGKGIQVNGVASSPGTQFTGLVHDVQIAGMSQDYSAVFHCVAVNGQSWGQSVEGTSFYYYKHINTIGSSYDSVIEGGQAFENVGQYNRGGNGWLHLLQVKDGTTYPLTCYYFIQVYNALDPSTWSPLSGYTSFIADSVLSAYGKWKKIFGNTAESTIAPNNMPLTLSECGIDLYTSVTWATILPAIKISMNSYIDLHGGSAGHYYIKVNYDGVNYTMDFVVNGSGAVSLYSGNVVFFQPVTVYSDLYVDGSLYVYGATKSFKIPHPMDKDKWLIHSAVEAPRADLIYRGTTTLEQGVAQVDLDKESGMIPGTFAKLTQNCQVFATSLSGWNGVRGKVVNGTLHLEGRGGADEVGWLVLAERGDPTMISSEATNSKGQLLIEVPVTEDELAISRSIRGKVNAPKLKLKQEKSNPPTVRGGLRGAAWK